LDKPGKDTASIIPWIGKTAKHIDYFIGDTMRSHGINLSKEQFIVLKYLHEEDGRKQNELAFITNRSKTALTRLIHTMEKKGLVSRKVCKEDLRINHVYLTQKGKEIWAKSRPHFLEIIEELQTDISSKDLDVAIKVLEQIQTNINQRTIINESI